MQTFAMNTTDQVVDGTQPGHSFQPFRYTEGKLEEIQNGVWLLLTTWLGTYKWDVDEGLDVEAIQDPITSDAEAGELVADVVLGYPGVERITLGPTVVRSDEGKVITITVEAQTVAGTIGFAVPVP